eukprot:1156479-Pelagomonas_calceolata.AAC.8
MSFTHEGILSCFHAPPFQTLHVKTNLDCSHAWTQGCSEYHFPVLHTQAEMKVHTGLVHTLCDVANTALRKEKTYETSQWPEAFMKRRTELPTSMPESEPRGSNPGPHALCGP